LDKVPTAAYLGAGEKEVLALGMQTPGAVLVLDERLARFYAEEQFNTLKNRPQIGLPATQSRKRVAPPACAVVCFFHLNKEERVVSVEECLDAACSRRVGIDGRYRLFLCRENLVVSAAYQCSRTGL